MAEHQTVLVIEDDPNDVFLLKRAFSKAAPDILLRVVRNGREAIDYLKGLDTFADRAEHPLPALLVLDLNLPGMNGFDLIKWVRNESACRNLPIVVLSSSISPIEIARAQELGINAYHVKPSDANALVGMVQGIKARWVDRTPGT